MPQANAPARTILITGCSSGIGYDAAHGLAARGWRVFATCRKPEDCERLIAEGLESLPLDCADPDSITAALAEVLDRTGGRLDALFNNAGFGIPAAVEDLPRDALRALFETNLFGLHDLTRQVIPVMRAQGSGRIVMCASSLGIVAMKWRGAYVASKFALIGLSDTLRLELRGTGIGVSVIEPGPITTRFRQNSRANFERWINLDTAARAEEYRADVMPRLYDTSGTPDRFELPPAAVTRALIHALDANRPRAHYPVTTATHIAAIARRLLPARLIDRALDRI